MRSKTRIERLSLLIQLKAAMMKIGQPAQHYRGVMVSNFARHRIIPSYSLHSLFSAATCKVIADLVLSMILLFVLAPVMIAIAACVALDGGPVLYRHLRIGKGGQRFYCLKFRSMALDGEKVLAERLAQDPSARDEWVATQKLKSDPRVTRAGRFLRATSLDELPQIFKRVDAGNESGRNHVRSSKASCRGMAGTFVTT